MKQPEMKETQHCTYEGSDDYTFSHTAGYCGRPQPRLCGCAFCYPEYELELREEVHIIQDGERRIVEVYSDLDEAERELYRLNNLTEEAKRLHRYGTTEWYSIHTWEIS